MIGLLALATGLAYTALGVIAVYELIRYRRDRGFSHFGLSFAVMAFTCGPHHLVHAYRHLVLHEPAHGPMLAAMALGARRRSSSSRCALEATFGGRGDRLIRNSRSSPLVPPVMIAVAGATLWEAFRHAAAMHVDLRALVPNVVLFVNYALVGYFTARTQFARRPLLDGWSLSGVAMSGVFVTCAISHLVAGLLTGSNPAGVALRQRRRARRRSTSCGRFTACTAIPSATGTAARWSVAPPRWVVALPGQKRTPKLPAPMEPPSPKFDRDAASCRASSRIGARARC